MGIRRRINSLIDKIVINSRYRESARERFGRQDFFYNAFKALYFNGIDGDYAEFGCCGAATFALAYHEACRHQHRAKLWAFDSFEGLPAQKGSKDSHPRWVEKTMATSLDRFHELCAIRRVPRDAYTVVPGFYDKVLPKFTNSDAPTNIALAYIDCDLFSSTIEVLRFLEPRLKHGMIIAFDDYFCWSATNISGERMAMLDFFSENGEWNLIPYMNFGWHGFSYVIEDRRLMSHIRHD